jgi:hypothetical protein
MTSSQSTIQISREDLMVLGLDHLAYVKPIKVDGRRVYAIHAADGTQIKILADHDLAFIAVRQNNLEPLSVH